MKMKFYNIIDEKGRFKGYKVELCEYGKQVDTHTVSYMYIREQLKELGEVMGFDKDERNNVESKKI